MIKKLLTGKVNSITAAALMVALSSLTSRFLGIFRDRILAGQFGAGDTLDIYYAAFRIPDLIFNLLILGALSAGFIPIFTSLFKNEYDKNEEAWTLSNNALNILGLSLIAVSLVGIALAHPIMRLITPGFSEEKMRMTASMTRIMFLSPFFLGISGVLGGILQSTKRFFVYSLAPIFYNVGIILGALYFVPVWGIHGLAWGVVFGAVMHMSVQLPAVFNLGFRYRPIFDLKNKAFRRVARMMVPRTMSLAIAQINLTVETIVASTLASGSLAIYNFANNLQVFPVGIFGISFAVAAFPTISAVAFDQQKLVKNFSSTLRQILFFIVPSMVMLLVLRAQIIRVVLGTGRFNWDDTVLTIHTLGFFSISLFAQALVPLLVRVFYARHDSRTPFFIGLGTAAINVFLAFFLSKRMGVSGLALAFSTANIANFIVLWLVLRFELGSLDELKILQSVLKFSAAAVLAGLAAQLTKGLVWPFIDMTKTSGVFIQGAAAGLAGLGVYLLICALLRSEELSYFWGGFKRRLSWKKLETGDQGEVRGI